MEAKDCLLAIQDSPINFFDPPCHVNEITAPLFLWIACAVLAIVTIGIALKFFFESRPLIVKFRKLRREIENIPPRNKPLDGTGIEQIRELLTKDNVLSEQWSEFEETLLFETDADQNTKVFNTHQASEYFDEAGLIEARVSTAFYVAFPGILTSLGLLLTFIAILMGLSHIKEVNGEITGIKELVYSLSGKFISSIAALILATVFTGIEKRITKTLNRSYRAFIGAIDRRFARMPAEHLLRDIRRDIGQQAVLFQQFGTDLSGRLKESFREGMDPLVARIATALEELTKQKSESVTDTIGKIIGEFKNTLMGSTDSEFKALASTLSSTTSTLESMNRQGERSQEALDGLIKNIETLMTKNSEAGSENLSRLANVMEGTLAKLRETTSSSSESFTQAVTNVLERLEQSSRVQLEENSKRSIELSTLVRGLMEQAQQSINLSADSLKSTVSNVVETTSTHSAQTTARLAELLEQQARNASVIESAKNSLNEALTLFQDAVQRGSSTLTKMDDGANSLHSGIQTLNTTVEQANKLQDNTNTVADLARSNFQQLAAVITQQSDLLTQYQRTFAELDKSIGALLSQIATSLENYTSKVKSGLESNLAQFDNFLGNATSKLGGTVQQLNDSLDDLMEASSKAKSIN